MTIRPLRPADPEERAAWHRLRRALWPDCEDAMHAYEIARHLMRGDDTTVLMAETEQGLIGFAELSIRARVEGSTEDRVGYLEGWYVEPAWQGRGVGRRLIEAGEQWTRTHGLNELASDAELSNEGSIAAHHALGFQETFRIVQFLKRLD
ncbi:MAG: GNAT family N-acetyltransferase [Rhodothermaceae bacterium]|nr:GNAT family N-acetyltransferase [Rhodothermaceae bacterium]